jgi:hypothetical protein
MLLVVVLLPAFLPLAKLLSVSADCGLQTHSPNKAIYVASPASSCKLIPTLDQVYNKKSDITDAVSQNRARQHTSTNHNPSRSSF